MGKVAEEHDRRETWRDWLRAAGIPEPTHLITRGELLQQLADRNIPVDERTLRHWEHQGALPHPVRQSYHGRVQATYPIFMVDVVTSVAQLRQQLPLRRLLGLGRLLFADFARMDTVPKTELAPPERPRPRLPDPLVSALGQFLAEHGGGTLTVRVDWHAHAPTRYEHFAPPSRATDKNAG